MLSNKPLVPATTMSPFLSLPYKGEAVVWTKAEFRLTYLTELCLMVGSMAKVITGDGGLRTLGHLGRLKSVRR
jgi:hypothetical protein